MRWYIQGEGADVNAKRCGKHVLEEDYEMGRGIFYRIRGRGCLLTGCWNFFRVGFSDVM